LTSRLFFFLLFHQQQERRIMGAGHWNVGTYTNYAINTGLLNKDGTVSNKSANEIYTAKKINQALSPKGVKIRESRDSTDHPVSNAIILALDVTGSMGLVAAAMAKKGLPMLMKEIYERKPVTDPQVMFMGFDDIHVGGHFQVSQFESDIRIAEQLNDLWLENNGGGNDFESYSLPWLFAALHTSTDCWEKRGKKGYLFTVGDELPTPELHKADVQRTLGYAPEGSLKGEDLLKKAQKSYEVFHIIADEGSFARSNKKEVHNAWEELMGDHVIHLPDHTKIAEVIVSTIQVAEGANLETVAASWDKATAHIVSVAVKNVKRVLEL
jgi:hypothetical protein